MYKYKSYNYTEQRSPSEFSSLGRALSPEEEQAVWEWTRVWDEAKVIFERLWTKRESEYISDFEDRQGAAAASIMRDMTERCAKLGVIVDPIARKVSGTKILTEQDWLNNAAKQREEREERNKEIQKGKALCKLADMNPYDDEISPPSWPKPINMTLQSVKGGKYVNGKYVAPSQEELLDMALRLEAKQKEMGEYRGPVELSYFESDADNAPCIIVKPTAKLAKTDIPVMKNEITEEVRGEAERLYLGRLIEATEEGSEELLPTKELKRLQRVAKRWADSLEAKIPEGMTIGEAAEYLCWHYDVEV